jgi:hypothetical protein
MKEENSQALGLVLGSFYWAFRHLSLWVPSSILSYFQYKEEGRNLHGLEIFI